MKYCEACKKKQREAESKRLANSRKIPRTIGNMAIKPKIKKCEHCQKEFLTKGGIESLSQRFCSKECQFSFQRAYNRMVSSKGKRVLPTNSPAVARPLESI